VTSGKDLSHGATVLQRGWDLCLQCRFPYVIEDLVPQFDPWTRSSRGYLCRWHDAHPETVSPALRSA
jgi:hypothetical protein